MIKVCHITSVHSWNDSRIFYKECVSLAKCGYDTTLLIVNGIDEVVEGVKIVNVPFKNNGRLNRIAFTGKVLLKKAIELEADIYHLHDPELLRIALRLKKKTGANVVFDAHEDLPKQIMDKAWIPSFLRKSISGLAHNYEMKIARKIDGIVSVTETICERFRKANVNVALVANFPNLNEMVSYSDLEIQKTQNSVCYVGALFETRGIKELVQAINMIDATLYLAGTFSEAEYEQEVKNLPGWSKVEYLGYLDRKEIIRTLQKSQIGIVTLHPTKSYKESMPIKLFEYMLAKLPVIASDFELWKPIVEKNNCGLMVDPLNPHEIAEKINYLLSNDTLRNEMGENGYQAVIKNYTWESQFRNLVELYNRLDKYSIK